MSNQYDDDNEVYDADFAEISSVSDSDKKEEKKDSRDDLKNSDRFCSKQSLPALGASSGTILSSVCSEADFSE